MLLQRNSSLTALDLSDNGLGGSQMDSVVVLSKVVNMILIFLYLQF